MLAMDHASLRCTKRDWRARANRMEGEIKNLYRMGCVGKLSPEEGIKVKPMCGLSCALPGDKHKFGARELPGGLPMDKFHLLRNNWPRTNYTVEFNIYSELNVYLKLRRLCYYMGADDSHEWNRNLTACSWATDVAHADLEPPRR